MVDLWHPMGFCQLGGNNSVGWQRIDWSLCNLPSSKGISVYSIGKSLPSLEDVEWCCGSIRESNHLLNTQEWLLHPTLDCYWGCTQKKMIKWNLKIGLQRWVCYWIMTLFGFMFTVVPLTLLSWLITRLTRVHGRYIEPHGFINQIISGWWFRTFFIFPYIGNLIIPTDEIIFFRGVGIPPTRNRETTLRLSFKDAPWLPWKIARHNTTATQNCSAESQEILGEVPQMEYFINGGTPNWIVYDE